MFKRFAAVGLAIGILLTVSIYAQKTTEVFIPIGESPGLSGKYSVIGEIRSFDCANQIVTIRGEDGEHRARVTDRTKIWLDSSEIKKTNEEGSTADCQAGRLCEIKYVYDGANRTEDAEWIKIRVSESGD